MFISFLPYMEKLNLNTRADALKKSLQDKIPANLKNIIGATALSAAALTGCTTTVHTPRPGFIVDTTNQKYIVQKPDRIVRSQDSQLEQQLQNIKHIEASYFSEFMPEFLQILRNTYGINTSNGFEKLLHDINAEKWLPYAPVDAETLGRFLEKKGLTHIGTSLRAEPVMTQTFLLENNFKHLDDSYFHFTVKNFQTSYADNLNTSGNPNIKLTADGIIGPKTGQALEAVYIAQN